MSNKISNKRRALNTTRVSNEGTTSVPPASQRVLSIPELLSLIFGYLAHTDVAPSEGEEEDTELSSFSKPACSCPCRQCVTEDAVLDKNATGVISLPSPFAIPLAKQTRRKRSKRHSGRKGGRKDGHDEEGSDRTACHCRISTHEQLSTLFGKAPTTRKVSGSNKPSYNLSNALVCKRWSPIALDVLWRVVDRPERLFSFLDGSWGTKLKSTSPGTSERLKPLRGLHMAEWGEGRMPVWWESGVQAFLDISDNESDDESDFGGSEDDPTPPGKVRRRDFELFSFRSAPTPASWARFDRYARRVRHLVYTRPCLSESALNQIAVTRPRLVVLPRMHTLSWADNPLQHAVLFMHAGVTRLELRIELFGREKTDPHASAEQTLNTYNDLGLNDFSFSGGADGTENMRHLFGLGSLKEEVKPNRTITRTLATQLAEIPRRMPNIQTLCVSSFIPISLYLPALLCTLLRPPTAPTLDEETPSPSAPTLHRLRRLVLPRYYTNALVLEQLSLFPQLEVVEYQFDDALGWGRPNDVGLGRCVPKDWKLYEPEEHAVDDDDGQTTPRRGWFGSLVGGGKANEGDPNLEVQATSDSEEEELELTPQPSPNTVQASPAYTSPGLRVSSTIFSKLCDLNLTIPLTDARDLLLSSPPTELSPTDTSDTSLCSPNLPSISLTDRGLPSWPQNLVSLYLDAPPGFLAGPTEIKSLVHAIALACYGPSTVYDRKPARLERLSIVCCADLDSGYYPLNDSLDDTIPGIGDEKCLSRKTIDPLLELLPGSGTARPRFSLKLFEIIHHYSLVLTQEDVELIAERWGGCVEKLVLNCEPVAAFGIADAGMLDGDGGLDTQTNRPGATLTLAALLPFARHCTELRHLGLFIDASRGVRGLMQPVFSRHSNKKTETGSLEDTAREEDPIDAFTSKIAGRYLKYPLSHPSIPNAYPVFQKLERLSLGVSVLPISLDDLEVQFSLPKRAEDGASSVGDAEDDEGESNVGQAGSTVSFDEDDEVEGGTDKEELVNALRDAVRARIDSKEGAVGDGNLRHGDGDSVPQTSEDGIVMNYLRKSGVRLGLIEEDQLECEVKAATSSASYVDPSSPQDSSNLVPLFLAQILPCFPSSTHSPSPNSPPTSSALTTVIDAGTTLSACPTSLMASSWAIQKYWTVGEPFELEKETQRKRRWRRQREQQDQEDGLGSGGSGATAASPVPQSPTADGIGLPPNASSTLVVPFLPPSPSFSPPSGYLPRILSAVFRARVEKWLEMNETVLPTAVAMREGGWVWGGRVASELGKTQSEVDELQVRVEVMDGLTQTRARMGKGKEDSVLDHGPDRCIIC